MPEEAEERDRSDDEQERLNRQLSELLQELRVAIPGVQVLFAFLLVVPFQQRSEQLTALQKDIYFVALLSAAVATACLIAPSAYHRLVFERHDKPALIKFGSVQLIVGLLGLAVSMNAAVFFVVDFVFATTTVVVTVALLVSLYFTLWFGVGLVRRRLRPRGTQRTEASRRPRP